MFNILVCVRYLILDRRNFFDVDSKIISPLSEGPFPRDEGDGEWGPRPGNARNL